MVVLFVPVVILYELQRRENIGLIDLTPSFESHRLHQLKPVRPGHKGDTTYLRHG
jgi:hypothetical protein